MTTGDILDLFQKRAGKLGEIKETQSEIILLLAHVIANCKDTLAEEQYDELVHIGAVMYQDGLLQYRARTEVAIIMEKSSSRRKKH
jgi:hypothetical protein